MISVCDHDAYALVDPGATHSFISVPFTERHRIEFQPIDGRVVVSVSNRDTMISKRIVPGSRLVIQNKDFCHASNPGPTRLADPNRFLGRETMYWDSLPVFFFFFKSQLAPVGYSPHLIHIY